MKNIITASILTLAIASPALAEQPAAWPRYPHQGIESQVPYRGPIIPPKSSATYNVWTDVFVPFDTSRTAATGADAGGQSQPLPADLDKQYAAHRAYWIKRSAELITQDGELAPVLPVRVHERLNAQAFGSPVMGSDR